MLERTGGGLGGPNSVSFNFTRQGFIFVKKTEPVDEQMLMLIDAGAEDVNEEADGIEIYTDPSKLFEIKEGLIAKGFEIIESKLIYKPQMVVELNESQTDKLMSLVETLEEHDDVDNVFVNVA